MKKLAVIDLGSNSVRMSIYELDEYGRYKEVKSYRSMIKLSEGMTKDMLLKNDAMLRAVNALLGYRSIILKENADSTLAVATAAVRKAANGKEFLANIRESCGIDVKVIDGEKEAYYDFLAVKHSLDEPRGVICDIGGGSTELIGFTKDKGLSGFVSIPMGSRSIYEMFFKNGETEAAYLSAEKYIEEKISEISWLSGFKGSPVIGIGGCLRALAKYDLSDSTSGRLLKHTVKNERIDLLFDKIKSSNIPERAQLPGITEERADIILSGLMPLMCLKDKLSMPYMTAMDVGVRDGIVAAFAEKNF